MIGALLAWTLWSREPDAGAGMACVRKVHNEVGTSVVEVETQITAANTIVKTVMVREIGAQTELAEFQDFATPCTADAALDQLAMEDASLQLGRLEFGRRGPRWRL